MKNYSNSKLTLINDADNLSKTIASFYNAKNNFRSFNKNIDTLFLPSFIFKQYYSLIYND